MNVSLTRRQPVRRRCTVDRRVADRRAGQDRSRPDDRRDRDQEPAARSRNPYNFAFLQANVTGYENNEFGVPRINANGSQMHTNYQIDGNTKPEGPRRPAPAADSEVLVREVKVITNGFAPEFGQTTGMVYNAITPSGTNDVHGSASYRFKRNAMSARPFFLASTARKPDTEANDVTATLGGPIQRTSGTSTARTSSWTELVTGDQVITVAPADAQALGITLPGDGVIPAHQRVNFRLRQDRLSARRPAACCRSATYGFKNFRRPTSAAG